MPIFFMSRHRVAIVLFIAGIIPVDGDLPAEFAGGGVAGAVRAGSPGTSPERESRGLRDEDFALDRG